MFSLDDIEKILEQTAEAAEYQEVCQKFDFFFFSVDAQFICGNFILTYFLIILCFIFY